MYKIDDHYSITVLKSDEVSVIADLALAHIDETPCADTPPDRDYLIHFFTGCVGVQQDSCVLFLKFNEEYVGYIIVIKSFHPMWHNVKAATELGWWVHKDHRSAGVGVKLVNAAEEWAKFAGVQKFSMASQTNEYMDRLDKVYTKLGYTLIEKIYVKDIK